MSDSINGRDPKGRFLTGNTVAKGRLGIRQKLENVFLEALHADFQEHGPSVIVTARIEKPVEYLRVVASVLPKETNVSITKDANSLSDAELDQLIRELATALGFGASEEEAPVDPGKLN